MRGSKSIWLAGAALSAVAGSAAAQVPTESPPVRETIDGNGVDLFRGTFVARQPLLTIGANQGLSYDYIYRGNIVSVSVYGALSKSGTTYMVTFDGRSDRFELSGSTYVATEAGGQTLTLSGNTYTYTSRDGTQVLFSKVYANTLSSGNTNGNEGRITQVLSTNGANLTYAYQTDQYCSSDGGGGGGGGGFGGRGGGGGNIPEKRVAPDRSAGQATTSPTGGASTTTCSGTSIDVERLTSITNSYGYQLAFAYEANDPNDTTVTDSLTRWWRITSVTAKSLGGCGQATCTWPTLNATVALAPVNVPSNSYTLSTATGSSAGKVVTVKRYGETAAAQSIDYDTAGRVYHVTDQLGATTYTYADTASTNERKVTVTNPLGDATTYVFNIIDTGSKIAERVKRVSDALGHFSSFTYDVRGRLKRTTYPEGNYVEQVYDSEQTGKGDRGNVVQVIRASKTAAKTDKVVDDMNRLYDFNPTCSGNDRFGLPVTAQNCNAPRRISDERPVDISGYAWTEYRYNEDGSLASVKSPLPVTGGIQPEKRYTYQSLTPTGGQAITMPSTVSECRTLASCDNAADQRRTVYKFDLTRNLLPTSVQTRSGDSNISTTTVATWSPVGDLLSVDGPATGTDDTTLLLYDTLRRRVGVISPDPDGAGAGSLPRRAQKVTYGADNLVDSVEFGTVPENATTLANFTSRQKTAYGDYQNGRPRSVKQSIDGTLHAVTHTAFDVAGQTSCVAQRLNRTVWNTFADACTLQALGADGEDRVTRWQYADDGRVANVTTGYLSGQYDADHNVQSIDKYTYTDNGQAETATDGLNNKTTYAYDGLDRLWQTHYPDKTTANTSSATDYEELTYEYRGNLSKRLLRGGTQAITYGYDGLSRLTSKTRPATGNNDDFGFVYDNFGDVTSITSTTLPTVTRDYDAFGRLTAENSVRLGNLAWTYDGASRIRTQTWGDGVYVKYYYLVTGEMDTVLENGSSLIASYAYDDLGRRTSLTRGNAKVVTTYGYTAGSPYLASLSHDLYGTANDVTTTFAYNNAGQIDKTVRTNDVYAWDGHYNVNRPYRTNGLNQYTATGPTNNPTATFTYDTKGNLTSDGTRSYGYTPDNELATFGAGTSATYDAAGQLEELDDGPTTTRFHRVGGEIATELSTNGTILRRYVRGAGADEVLAQYEGSDTSDRRYFVADERGSIVATTGFGGGLLQVGAYDEYGVPEAGFTSRFGYTGQAWFPSIGLYDYKARMYSPTLGRFLQTDPIGYGDGFNWYNYTGNDPVNANDPTGLLCSGWRIINGVDQASETSSASACGSAGGTYYPDIVATAPGGGYLGGSGNGSGGIGDRSGGGKSVAKAPQNVNVDPSCKNVPAAYDPAVQSQALNAMRMSLSPSNPAGATEFGFAVSEPYIGSGRYIGPIVSEGHKTEISGDYINRTSPSSIGNVITGYYPTSVFVHTHPNNTPPSPISDFDRDLGRPVIAIDKAGNMTCAAGG